jgi:hypothetical protein
MDETKPDELGTSVPKPEPDPINDLARELIDNAFNRRRLKAMSRAARLEYMRLEVERAKP